MIPIPIPMKKIDVHSVPELIPKSDIYHGYDSDSSKKRNHTISSLLFYGIVWRLARDEKEYYWSQSDVTNRWKMPLRIPPPRGCVEGGLWESFF